MTTTMQASKPSFIGRVAIRTNLSGKVRKATLPGAEPTKNGRKCRQTKLQKSHMIGGKALELGVRNVCTCLMESFVATRTAGAFPFQQ
mmetsp:Transcript_5276/g.33145  ORF Transcript_5276/g.33145 Transcript_5276/m.33145 type:complete len:88 (+) Transcript_5276:126-389(+)